MNCWSEELKVFGIGFFIGHLLRMGKTQVFFFIYRQGKEFIKRQDGNKTSQDV